MLSTDEQIAALDDLLTKVRNKYPFAWYRAMAEDAIAVASFSSRGGRTVVLQYGGIGRQLKPEDINFPIERPQWSAVALRKIQKINSYPILKNASQFLLSACALYVIGLLLIAQKKSFAVIASTACMLTALGHYTSIVLFGRLYDFRWFHETYFFSILGISILFAAVLKGNLSIQGPDDVFAPPPVPAKS